MQNSAPGTSAVGDGTLASVAVMDRRAIEVSPHRAAEIAAAKSRVSLNDPLSIERWGDEIDRRISEFNDTMTDRAKGSDMGEVGALVANAVIRLRGLDPDVLRRSGGIVRRLMGGAQGELVRYRQKFVTAEAQVEGIVRDLHVRVSRIERDTDVLVRDYDENRAEFEALGVLIEAGRELLDEARGVELPILRGSVGDDAFKARDLARLEANVDRLDKKVEGFELRREETVLTAAEIQMLQEGALTLGESIRGTIKTVGQWKKRFRVALGIENLRLASEANRLANDLNNEMIKKTAAALGAVSIEIARQSERPVIDVETLETAQSSLIEGFDGVRRIVEGGHAAREGRRRRLGELEEIRRRRHLPPPSTS